MTLVPCVNCGHAIVEHRLDQDLTTGACLRCDCERFVLARDRREQELPPQSRAD
jgi:hypothetical protein